MFRLASMRKNWITKWKAIALDYKSAAEGTWTAAKNRPYRSIFYTGCTVFAFVAYKTSPCEESYLANIVESSNELLLCGSERSQKTENYFQNIFQLWSKGMLRYKNLGLFSIVYYSEHNKETKSFKAVCKYSNPRWHNMPEYVLDIGGLGRWWKAKYIMTDYDVDFAEIPKDFNGSFQKYFDFFKAAFGYSYFNNLKAQPIKTKIYVECSNLIDPADEKA